MSCSQFYSLMPGQSFTGRSRLWKIEPGLHHIVDELQSMLERQRLAERIASLIYGTVADSLRCQPTLLPGSSYREMVN